MEALGSTADYNLSMTGPVIAAGGIGAAIAAGYQSMSPTGQWYGRTFSRFQDGSRRLALTYDDGPNDPHTLRLLEVLDKHQIHATFFVIGQYVQKRPDIVREIAEQGHVIGNHTFNHPLLIFKSEAEIKRQITECKRAINDAVGEHSNLFRPPFGGRRPAVIRIARELGLQPVMWNVTGYDWNAPAAETIERKVSREIKGGDIVLLHDGGHKKFGADRSSTVAASDTLISQYKSEGYEFVTIPDAMSNNKKE